MRQTLAGTSTVTLPPASTASKPITQIGGTQVSLAGATTSQVLARKRTWTFSYDFLTDAEYDLIAQFADGRQGNGPFTLTDGTVTAIVLIPPGSEPSNDITVEGFVSSVTLTLQEV